MTGALWGGGEEAGVERQAQSSGAKVPSPTRVAGCLSPLSSGTGPSGTLVLVLRPRVPCDSVWLSPGNRAFCQLAQPRPQPQTGAGTQLLPGRASLPAATPAQRCPAWQRGRSAGCGGSAPLCPLPVAYSCACGVRARDVGRGDKVSVNQEEQVRTVYGAVSFSMGQL